MARQTAYLSLCTCQVLRGMASLFCQPLTVLPLVVITLLKVYRFNETQTRIGSCFLLRRVDAVGHDLRAAAYARFDLTEKEKNSVTHSNLSLHRSYIH